MKEVKAICIYKRSTNQIYNLSVIKKDGTNINLLTYETGTGKPAPYEYNTFSDLYKGVLGILKCNNFYVGYTEEFGKKLYNIYFINIEHSEVRTDKMYF